MVTCNDKFAVAVYFEKVSETFDFRFQSLNWLIVIPINCCILHNIYLKIYSFWVLHVQYFVCITYTKPLILHYPQ